MRTWTIILAAAPLLLPGAAAAQAPFVAAADPDLWRASRLVGLDVLGPGGEKVGAVTDVLLDREGRAVDVVIGVGGFLGAGRKDVALPYGLVRFADAPRPGSARAPAAAPSAEGGPTGAGRPAAALGGPEGTTAAVPGGVVSGLAPTPAPGAPGGPTAGVAAPASRPDHATVDLSLEQLKAAPAFAFTRRDADPAR